MVKRWIEGFEGLKSGFTSPSILALLTFEGTFNLAADGSISAVGAVLTKTIDGRDAGTGGQGATFPHNLEAVGTPPTQFWIVIVVQVYFCLFFFVRELGPLAKNSWPNLRSF